MIVVWIAKLLAAFNANVRPSEVGASFALGFLMALIPAGNLLWFALFLLSFFLKINQAVFFVFLAIFKLIAGVFDPLLDSIGYAILSMESLRPLFTSWLNTPIVPWTGFNNTLVSGGLLFGLLCFVPLTIGFSLLVKFWRTGLREKLVNWGPVKAFLQWPIVSTISGLLGKVLSVAKEFA